MPFLNVGSNGNDLTLQVPTRGITDWATEFLQNFAQPISEHDHTGGGRGAQLGAGAFADNSISGTKILFNNDEAFQQRDSGGTETDLFKLDSSDLFRILYPLVHIDQIKNNTVYTLTNNQSSDTQIGSLSLSGDEGAIISYKVNREGTTDLFEKGVIEVSKRDGVWNYAKSRLSGAQSGVDLKIDEATGNLVYTSTDNPGSSSEKLYLNIIKLGEL